MAYIGKEPIVGNFQVCDPISVVNGQASYTMQVSSVNVVPESANHMLVSLNGILQKPNSSFTVSSSTISFASNLQTGDVIDFIMLLGNVLDIGTPSDSTVTDAKANFVSTSSGAGLQIKGDGTTDGTLQLNCRVNSHGIKLKSPPHSAGQSYTLTFPSTAPSSGKALVTDGSGNLSFSSAGGLNLISTSTTSSGVSEIDITSGIDSTYKAYRIYVINLHPSDESGLRLQVFHSGSAYTSSNYNYSGDGYRSNNVNLTSAGTSLTYMPLPSTNLGNSDAEHVSAIIDLYNPSETTFEKYIIAHIVGQDSASRTFNYQMATSVQSNNAIDGLRFYMGSGNIDSAIIKLYGIS